MFKATVVASKLREDLAHYLEMVKNDQAVQILHRGAPVRVLITQDHYLDLLSRLALHEKKQSEKAVSTSPVKALEARLMKKLRALDEEAFKNDSSRMGKKRAK